MDSNLNEKQQELVSTTEGTVVVDAGPGTGKTHTIVRRYTELISMGVSPSDIMMITFTRNAAQEMRDRISSVLIEEMEKESDEVKKMMFKEASRNVKTSTFDSLCLDIVRNSPEKIRDFFGTKDILSRNVSIVENETLNKEYFQSFYAEFARYNGMKYVRNGKDPAALLGNNVNDIYGLICKLMARGVIPKECEWFGNGGKIVNGCPDEVRSKLKEIKLNLKKEEFPTLPLLEDSEIADAVADDDNFYLTDYIRDVYYNYICASIRDCRLTFGLAELFAFAILYAKGESKDVHSVKYMIIDEFQDTNELQMKICLMLLETLNMCAVGDWKQGIFGFRFVSIENITEFDTRIRRFAEELEADGNALPFKVGDSVPIKFADNYRSSQLILDKAFESLDIPGRDKENIKHPELALLRSVNDDLYKDHTHVECIQSDTFEEEIDSVVDRILEYRNSNKYRIVSADGSTVMERTPNFGDMAVLCRTSRVCNAVLDRCRERGVPAFFQGDLEVMNSREGKLVLAWLRLINNNNDRRGIVTILEDLGYPMSEISAILAKSDDPQDRYFNRLPTEIKDQVYWLSRRKRRPNDLLTSIFAFYGLDNDITQSIVNIISSAYSGSLITISDLIRLIEEDIKNKTRYSVDPSLDMKAVTIQTMHKSKGLEYPIVIIAGLNSKTMPSSNGEKSILRFNDEIGIRCTKEYCSSEIDGMKNDIVVDSWKYELIKKGYPTDYSEERRLMFVAMTRAKQYLTLTASNPGRFFAHYMNEQTADVLAKKMEQPVIKRFENTDDISLALSERPSIEGYTVRSSSLSAHDLMDTLPESVSTVKGKGADYGTEVHNAAYMMVRGIKVNESYEECDEIRKVLDRLKGAKLYPELKCVLPIGNTSVKGTIDLLADFGDRIEIHDYKTDADTSGLDRYRLQLSIYAYAAASTGKPVRCFIDFLTLRETKEIVPLPFERLEEAVSDYYRRLDTQ